MDVSSLLYAFTLLSLCLCDVPITELYRCDFEDDVCGFTSSPANVFRRNKGGTPSHSTGPEAAPEGDYYAYFEATESAKEAVFDSSLIDSSSAWYNYRISFWLHANGSQLGDLYLRILSSKQEILETFSITAQSSEKWKYVTKFINPKAGNGDGLFKIQFFNKAKGYSGDYAIDSIWIGAYHRSYCFYRYCSAHAICEGGYPSGCTCKKGYVGNGVNATKINGGNGCFRYGDCSHQPCAANAVCLHSVCSCTSGFQGNGVKRSLKRGTGCSDTNECVISNVCGQSEQCVNTPGGYKCACKPGFYKPAKEGATCTEKSTTVTTATTTTIKTATRKTITTTTTTTKTPTTTTTKFPTTTTTKLPTTTTTKTPTTTTTTTKPTTTTTTKFPTTTTTTVSKTTTGTKGGVVPITISSSTIKSTNLTPSPNKVDAKENPVIPSTTHQITTLQNKENIPPTQDSINKKRDEEGLNMMIIYTIVAAVGGVVILIALISILTLCFRKKHFKDLKKRASNENPHTTPIEYPPPPASFPSRPRFAQDARPDVVSNDEATGYVDLTDDVGSTYYTIPDDVSPSDGHVVTGADVYNRFKNLKKSDGYEVSQEQIDYIYKKGKQKTAHLVELDDGMKAVLSRDYFNIGSSTVEKDKIKRATMQKQNLEEIEKNISMAKGVKKDPKNDTITYERVGKNQSQITQENIKVAYLNKKEYQ